MPATTTMTVRDLLTACRASDAGTFKLVARAVDGKPRWAVIVVTDTDAAKEILAAVEAVEAGW